MKETNEKNNIINLEDAAPGSLMQTINNNADEFFVTIADDGTIKSKMKIFNAINNSDNNLSDCLGQTIEVKDVAMHTVEIADMNTGEIRNCTRVVLIDKNGVGYSSISEGIFSAVKKLFIVFGLPTWDEPVKVQCREVKTRKNYKTFTLDVVAE